MSKEIELITNSFFNERNRKTMSECAPAVCYPYYSQGECYPDPVCIPHSRPQTRNETKHEYENIDVEEHESPSLKI